MSRSFNDDLVWALLDAEDLPENDDDSITAYEKPERCPAGGCPDVPRHDCIVCGARVCDLDWSRDSGCCKKHLEPSDREQRMAAMVCLAQSAHFAFHFRSEL